MKRERTPYTINTIPITLRLDATLHEWLREQAQREQRSLNSQIAVILQRAKDYNTPQTVNFNRQNPPA